MAPKKKRLKIGDILSNPNSIDRANWNLLFASSTPHRADERWQYLLHGSDFEDALKKLRRRLKIPVRLNPSSDAYARQVPVEDGDVDLVESRWVDSLGKDERSEFDKAIRSLLVEYGLPIDFDDRICYWLLYRAVPRWVAPLGIEHTFHAIDDPSEMERIPLNVAEQKLLMVHLKKRSGSKGGRPRKEDAKYFALIRNALATSKNKTRRFRSLKNSLAAVKLKGQQFVDDRNKHEIKSKKTYLDLAGELRPVERIVDSPSHADDERAAATIRAQKSRFLKRGGKAGRKVKR